MKKFIAALTLVLASFTAQAQRYYHGYRGGYYHGPVIRSYGYYGHPYYTQPYVNPYYGYYNNYCPTYDAWGNCVNYAYPQAGIGFNIRIR